MDFGVFMTKAESVHQFLICTSKSDGGVGGLERHSGGDPARDKRSAFQTRNSKR